MALPPSPPPISPELEGYTPPGPPVRNNISIDEDAGTPTQQPREDLKAVGTFPKPRKNPLGKFASYTYQITLYMITPDAYNAFVNTGRRNINALRTVRDEDGNIGIDSSIEGGAFIVAQSGGVNEKFRFSPNFNLDYYIDKLSIRTHSSGTSELNYSEFSFTITEPYGFSFLTNLRKATEQIGAISKALNYKFVNPSKQFYILGIRFYGYDEKGNIVNDKDSMGTNENSNQIFERFFDITITELKFKLDGKATVYNIKANGTAVQGGATTKRGTVKQGVSIQASTVEEALNQLKNKMNYDEEKANTDGPRNTFDIRIVGDEVGANAIRTASLVTPSDKLKSGWATSNAKNVLQANELESVTAVPNSTRKNLTFKGGLSIVDAINGIVKQSNYMVSALNTIYSTKPSSSSGQPITDNPGTTELQWYNLSVELANANFNEKLKDWVYDITYVIQPYAAPAVYSPFISKTRKFYGPHKRYEYYFTGQNSEVISYEQAYNTTYYTVALNGSSIQNGFISGELKDDLPSLAVGKRTDQSRMGLPDIGFEAQNQVLTSLYDVGALVSSKLTIMGDPDFLMSENPSSLSQVYNTFYGADGYTINPNGGQVFIEVDFNEAVDYDTGSGLLSVNENILFFNYPASIRNSIKGVIFQVYEVHCNFTDGKFTQTLAVSLPGWLADESAVEITNPRQDTDKEAAQAALNKEDARTLTPKVNYIDPVTSGALPKEGDYAKQTTQLTPDEKRNMVTMTDTTLKPDLRDALNPNILGSTQLSTGDD
jgi:hypothetical protein